MKTETKPADGWYLVAMTRDRKWLYRHDFAGKEMPPDAEIDRATALIRARIDGRGVDYDLVLMSRVASVTQPTEGTFTKYSGE